MTKDDIIKTAFRVWGRDLYRRTSLSSLAKELKVSKPALYRHFLSKDALNEAMLNHFFDEFTSYIRPSFEKINQMEDPEKRFFTIFQAIAGFYAKNCYALIFSLMNACEQKLDRETFSKEIKARGIDAVKIKETLEKKYDNQPGLLHLVFSTLSFYMGNFHKKNDSMANSPTEKQINDTISAIYTVIKQGLYLSPEQVNSLDFEKLEKLDESKINSEQHEPGNPMNALFKAVAEAVAEAGPWAASMEMVAKKMGLSKSSLYGHFKNKKDMLQRLFITEFKRIIDFARQGVSLSSNTAEQLYLGIYSIAVYLRSRPEILIAIDWIRTRRLDLGNHRKDTDKTHEIFRLFDDIDIESLRGRSEEDKQLASGWILFLLAVVMQKTQNKDGVHSNTVFRNNIDLQDKTHIRVLFRFIALGLGGFIK